MIKLTNTQIYIKHLGLQIRPIASIVETYKKSCQPQKTRNLMIDLSENYKTQTRLPTRHVLWNRITQIDVQRLLNTRWNA